MSRQAVVAPRSPAIDWPQTLEPRVRWELLNLLDWYAELNDALNGLHRDGTLTTDTMTRAILRMQHVARTIAAELDTLVETVPQLGNYRDHARAADSLFGKALASYPDFDFQSMYMAVTRSVHVIVLARELRAAEPDAISEFPQA
jgi:hypothetical protein